VSIALGRAMSRTGARRAAARVLVSRPAYRLFTLVPATAALVARAAFRTARDGILEAALDRLARRDPPPTAAQVLRADLWTFQGRYGDALWAAESAALADPSSAAAAARVVRLSYQVRERADADRIAVAAVERFPLAPDVVWQAALACRTPAQYGRLHSAWQAQATDPPDLPKVVRQWAVAAVRAGEVDAAAGLYRQAVRVLLASPGPVPPAAVTRLAGLGAGQAIRDLCDALDRAGVPFFFAAGTALGLIREGRPLGADGDIDVGVYDADWDRDGLIDVFTRDPRFDLDLHPQSQKVGLRHRGGSPVDIFRFYEQDGRVWHDGVFVRWHNSPFGVVRRQIGGLSVPLPENAERYLTECYGDWRTPVPAFDAFTDDAPNLEVTWPEYQRVHLLRRAYERLAGGDREAARRELERAGERDLADLEDLEDQARNSSSG
jgi:hypothetical protein